MLGLKNVNAHCFCFLTQISQICSHRTLKEPIICEICEICVRKIETYALTFVGTLITTQDGGRILCGKVKQIIIKPTNKKIMVRQ